MADAEFQTGRTGGAGNGGGNPAVPLYGFALGTVYGTILNFHSDLPFIEASRESKVYKAPPVAPVLYIKPPNTFCAHGGQVLVPADSPILEAAVTIGAVIGRDATALREDEALSHVLGFTLAIDVTVPHADVYRPPIAQRCRDGFLPIGPGIVERKFIARPDALSARLLVNGAPAQEFSAAMLLRPLATLLADVTEFLSLSAGDVLLLGVPLKGTEVRVGDRLTAEAAAIGQLQVEICAEAEP